MGWHNANAVDSYSGDAPFESRPEHWLFWLVFTVVFLGLSGKIPEQYLD
jgi:hypothetical protein